MVILMLTRLEELQTHRGIDKPGDKESGDETNADPFRSIRKAFSCMGLARNQYEYLVSWIGYLFIYLFID